jgi:hypothetical protein
MFDSKTNKNQYYKDNVEKIKERSKKWRQENPEKHRLAANKWAAANSKGQMSVYRLRKYNVTQEEFDYKFEKQQGLCAICQKPMERPCQDHDHVSGENRDLLCHACNLLLGNSREDIEILANAILYLQKHANGSSTQTAHVDSSEQCSVLSESVS